MIYRRRERDLRIAISAIVVSLFCSIQQRPGVSHWYRVDDMMVAVAVLTLHSRACSSHYRHNRPGFNTGHSLTDSRVFLHVYRAIDWPVPDWGFVGPVDHVDLDLNRPGQDLLPSILGYGLQAIALSLEVIRVLEVSRECRDIRQHCL